MDEDPEAPAEPYSAVVRRRAAHWAKLADSQEGIARRLRDLAKDVSGSEFDEPPGIDHIAAQSEAAVYRLRTMQRIEAEQAMAYDAMLAEGGPDNPEAYARYKESTELRGELMPMDYDNPDIDGPNSR